MLLNRRHGRKKSDSGGDSLERPGGECGSGGMQRPRHQPQQRRLLAHQRQCATAVQVKQRLRMFVTGIDKSAWPMFPV